MFMDSRLSCALRFGAILTILVFAKPAVLDGAQVPASVPNVLSSASELDYPPFALVLDDGSADGFSVELLAAVTKAVGLRIEFRVGPWYEIKQALIDGDLDVLPFVSYSKKRDEVLDFSASYLRLHGTVFVREGNNSIRSEADLKGKELLAMRGDIAHEYAVRHNLTSKLILTKSYEEAMRLLSSGKHDAVIMLHLVGFQLLNKSGISNVVSITSFQETNLKPDAAPLSGYEQKFCFAVQEGGKELLARLNEGLAIVNANGTYDNLYNKWFGPILPRPQVSWTRMLKYLASIIVPILIVGAIGGIWYLKRQVASKTQYLREEIEERKRAENAIQKSEAKFRKLFNVAAIPLCYVDNQGNVIDLNRKFTEVFGYTKADIPTLDDWWHSAYPDPEYRQWVFDTWQTALGQAEENNIDIAPIEYQIRCKNGQVRSVVISGGTFEDHFLATFVDMTERKKVEEELDRSNKELENFAYVASHDLQEPLRAIVGFLQLLKSRYQDQLDEKGRHYIDRSVNAGHRMQGLIMDLLTLSRVNTRGGSFIETDLRSLINNVLDDLQPIIDENNVAIRIERLPTVSVDPNQMQSLFQNLILNAVKYNDHSKPLVEIDSEENKDVHIISVKDNGIGISPEFQERIFIVFQRLHGREEYSGTGLGLALCKKIVERHSGEIWVQSEKGQGSTFCFTLPKKRGV